MTRNYSLQGLLFASAARTTVPPTPTVGIPYRKPSLTPTDASTGWPFSTVVDSADFNEVMYRVTTLLDFIEKNGGQVWSALTDYPVGALVRDDSFTFYEATAASGPNSGGTKVPGADGSEAYWNIATFHFYGGGYRVVFIGSNYTCHSNELVYCREACQVALPVSPVDQDRIKIITSDTISANNGVLITGTAIQQAGVSSVLMNEPTSFIELVWDDAYAMWKIEGLVCGGMIDISGGQIKLVPPMNAVQSTNTIDLQIGGQELTASLRIQSNMGLQTNADGVGVWLNPSSTNSIRFKDGGLYSGAVDEEDIHTIEKQLVFFNGEGNVSLGDLDVGEWSGDEEWPLPWDFGLIQDKGFELTCFGDTADALNGLFYLNNYPSTPFSRVWTHEKIAGGVFQKFVLRYVDDYYHDSDLDVDVHRSHWAIFANSSGEEQLLAWQTNSDSDPDVAYEDPTAGIWLDASNQQLDIHFAFLTGTQEDNVESIIDFGEWE